MNTKAQDGKPAETEAKTAPEVGRDPPDLGKYDAVQKKQDEGIDVEINDPGGRPTGIVIKVSGPDSERQRKAVQKLQDERLESDDVKPLNSEQIAHRQLRGLAMSVMSWNKFKIDGEVLSYSEANAVKLFNRYPWIREQVEAKAGRRQAFMKLSKEDASKLSDAGSTD